jgi:hypothetical protein
MQPFGTTRTFVSKQKAIAVLKPDVPEGPGSLCRKKPKPRRPHRTALKGVPTLMVVHVQSLPIVHSGPLQVTVRDAKSQGMNQVKPGVRHSAKPAHIAGVLGDLWFEKDDMDHGYESGLNSSSARAVDLREMRGYPRSSSRTRRFFCGNDSVTTVPTSSLLSMPTCPPCARIMRWTSISPSPCPPGLVVWYG